MFYCFTKDHECDFKKELSILLNLENILTEGQPRDPGKIDIFTECFYLFMKYYFHLLFKFV